MHRVLEFVTHFKILYHAFLRNTPPAEPAAGSGDPFLWVQAKVTDPHFFPDFLLFSVLASPARRRAVANVSCLYLHWHRAIDLSQAHFLAAESKIPGPFADQASAEIYGDLLCLSCMDPGRHTPFSIAGLPAA
jgi:hypothetical protein